MEEFQKPDSELEQTINEETDIIPERNGFTLVEYGAIVAMVGIIYALIRENVLDDIRWVYENLSDLGAYISRYFY